jgi:hypothetical protein
MNSVNIRSIQTVFSTISEIKTATIIQRNKLAAFVTASFPYFTVLPLQETDATLRLNIYGITILIRPEITAKLSPPEIATAMVAYQVLKNGQLEELQPLGEPIPLNVDGSPSGIDVAAFPCIYISYLVDKLLATSNTVFKP